MMHCRDAPTSTANSPAFSSFFFMDSASTDIYTLSLHDALPIFARYPGWGRSGDLNAGPSLRLSGSAAETRSEEHTSELQSRGHLVCRLLLEKKKQLTPGKRASHTGHLI